MKRVLLVALTLALVARPHVLGQDTQPAPSGPPQADTKMSPSRVFDELADGALKAMVKRAEELHIKGAAVVAYVGGDTVESWSSKMAVVGALKNPPSGNDRGANFIAIAYSKAAEMADTLKNSGHAGRPPMSGETGWQGGLIQKTKTGYLIAAFSGGPSEADLKVAQVGLDLLADKL